MRTFETKARGLEARLKRAPSVGLSGQLRQVDVDEGECDQKRAVRTEAVAAAGILREANAWLHRTRKHWGLRFHIARIRNIRVRYPEKPGRLSPARRGHIQHRSVSATASGVQHYFEPERRPGRTEQSRRSVHQRHRPVRTHIPVEPQPCRAMRGLPTKGHVTLRHAGEALTGKRAGTIGRAKCCKQPTCRKFSRNIPEARIGSAIDLGLQKGEQSVRVAFSGVRAYAHPTGR